MHVSAHLHFQPVDKKKSGLTFELLELKKEKYDKLEKSCFLNWETIAAFWDRGQLMQ